MTTLINRQEAEAKIARHLKTRESYVIGTGPEMIATAARALDGLHGWTGYLDSGNGVVLQTTDAKIVATVDYFVPAALVLLIPKSVSPSVLSAAFGQQLPADGSRDVVILTEADAATDSPPIPWPLLFLNAVEIAEPGATAAIRANAPNGVTS